MRLKNTYQARKKFTKTKMPGGGEVKLPTDDKPTRQKIYQDAEKIVDAEKEYLQSPEYKQLLQNELYGPTGTGPSVDPMINARMENLNELRVNVPYIPGLSLKSGTAAAYEPSYHKIDIRKDSYDPSVFRHELSHSLDSSYTSGADRVGDYFTEKLQKDLSKIGSKSLNTDLNYLSDPSEVKARLKALRDKSIEQGYKLLEPGYDINKYKDSFTPMENMQYKQLKDAGITDDKINEYMYLFAKQNQNKEKQVTAKYGANLKYLYQKGGLKKSYNKTKRFK